MDINTRGMRKILQLLSLLAAVLTCSCVTTPLSAQPACGDDGVFKLYAPECGLAGDGVTDDTDAFRAVCDALELAGRGTLDLGSDKTYLFLDEGSAPGPICSLVNMSDIRVVASGSRIQIDPNHVFTVGNSQNIFYLTAVQRATFDGLTVIGPAFPRLPADIDAGQGFGVITIGPGSRDIHIPRLYVDGGEHAVLLTNNGATAQCNFENILIGQVHARNIQYGINATRGVCNMTVDLLRSENSKRSFVLNGDARNVRANIHSKNPDGHDVLISSSQGSTTEGIHIRYSLGSDSTDVSSGSNNIVLFIRDEQPTTFRNMVFDLDIEYSTAPGAETGRGAFFLDKRNNSGDADQLDRGHKWENITIRGKIKNTPSYLASSLHYGIVSTNSFIVGGTTYAKFGPGDTMSNIRFEDLIIETSVAKPALVWACGACKDQVVLSNVKANQIVAVYESDATVLGGIPPVNAKLDVAGSTFPNFSVAQGYSGRTYLSPTFTAAWSGTVLGPGWYDRTIVGGSSNVVTTLPPCTSSSAGFKVHYHRKTAALRADPQGTDVVRDPTLGFVGGPAKYLQADSNGGSFTLECAEPGIYDVTSKVGTVSWEP